MIVVTAPASRIGTQLLPMLVRSGDVRVIARDPNHLADEIRDRVEIVTGSHADPDVLREAVNEDDTVFWLLPPDPHTDDIVEHYRRFVRPFTELAAAGGVRRVVTVTTLGQGWTRPAGHLTAGLVMDELIDNSGVSYRALRMPYFMDNLLEQARSLADNRVLAVPNNLDRPLLTVATQDIAPVAARWLLDPTWTGQDSVPVIGPDNLTPRQMAQTLARVVGVPIDAVHVSADDYRRQLTGFGLSNGFAAGLLEMAVAQDGGIYTADGARSPRTGTTFEAWCRDVLVPSLPTSLYRGR